jgi:hypothetical protein
VEVIEGLAAGGYPHGYSKYGGTTTGEHDCGRLEVEGYAVMFKIDYYDLDLRCASPDPADPNVTCRFMTLMLADEY